MKATGKRVVQLYKEVLRMNREDFIRLTGIPRSSLINIESGSGGQRVLEEMIESLQLNPTWVHQGKGSMWLTGTDEENVARIKAGGKNSSGESESFVEIKKELDRYREREDRLQRIIDRLLNGGTNFRKALGNASYRTPAKSVA